MNAGDVACKLVDMLDCLGTSACVMHGLGHRTDFLPRVIGKDCRVQPSKSLVFVLEGPPIITWSIGRVKLIAQHRRYGILVEEPGPKALAASAIASLIQGIGDLVGLYPFHAQFPKQAHARVFF